MADVSKVVRSRSCFRGPHFRNKKRRLSLTDAIPILLRRGMLMQLTGETNIVSLADKDNQWGRLVADDEYKQSLFSDSASGQLQEALRKLRSASVLISVTIKDELAGSNDQDVLERLYCAKGSVTCAIEETEKHFGG